MIWSRTVTFCFFFFSFFYQSPSIHQEVGRQWTVWRSALPRCNVKTWFMGWLAAKFTTISSESLRCTTKEWKCAEPPAELCDMEMNADWAGHKPDVFTHDDRPTEVGCEFMSAAWHWRRNLKKLRHRHSVSLQRTVHTAKTLQAAVPNRWSLSKLAVLHQFIDDLYISLTVGTSTSPVTHLQQSSCSRLLLVDMKAVPVWVSWPCSEEMCHALNCTSHHKITRVALGADNEHFSWADSLRLRLMLLQSDQTPSELPGPARKDLLLLYSNIHFPLWSREPQYLVSAKQNFSLAALNEDTNGHSHGWIFYCCFSSR